MHEEVFDAVMDLQTPAWCGNSAGESLPSQVVDWKDQEQMALAWEFNSSH